MFQDMFSTPGFPAQLAGEIVRASKQLEARRSRQADERLLASGKLERRQVSVPGSERAVAQAAQSDDVPGTSGDVAGSPADLVDHLYRDHSPRLVRQLTRQTGSREAALEIAQEAYVRLLRMTPVMLRSINSPESFLRRVSSNLLLDWGRTTARFERSIRHLESVCDDRFDQVAALESRDTLRRLEAAMDKLKPKTREIFLAHRLHGLSYAEIAQRTGLSVKGVEKQMARAIAKIDRLLDRA